VEIDTSTLGPIEIDETRIINFVEPMPGLESAGVQYALIDINPDSPVKLLQSLGDAHVCFLVADPNQLAPGYVVEASDEDVAGLELKSEDDSSVLVILTVLDGENGSTTANLKAPIVINRATFKARQVVLRNSTFSMKTPVAATKE
jgi:flagellar assembly factor FliW